MIEYGIDMRLVNDDIVVTPEGDILLIEGPACIAQDIDQSLKIVRGSLLWDKTAGSILPDMLNDAIDTESVLAELERVAIEDHRIDPQSVHACARSATIYSLQFIPLGTQDSLAMQVVRGGNGRP